MKLDYKTLSMFRAIIIEKNKLWCPDTTIRLRMHIQEHYIERMFERFEKPKDQAQMLIDAMAWIKQNYSRLQRENTWEKKIQYRVHSELGISVLILFNGVVTLRTCFPKDHHDQSS